MQAAQRRRVEPRADLAGVGQRAVVVVAQQQRAKPDAAAFRRGVADDYELLVAAALELEPVRRAPPFVWRVGQLGDHSLVATLTRRGESGLTVLDAMRGVAQRVVEIKTPA